MNFTLRIEEFGRDGGKPSRLGFESLADIHAFFALLSMGDADGRPQIKGEVYQGEELLFSVNRTGTFTYRFQYAG